MSHPTVLRDRKNGRNRGLHVHIGRVGHEDGCVGGSITRVELFEVAPGGVERVGDTETSTTRSRRFKSTRTTRVVFP